MPKTALTLMIKPSKQIEMAVNKTTALIAYNGAYGEREIELMMLKATVKEILNFLDRQYELPRTRNQPA